MEVHAGVVRADEDGNPLRAEHSPSFDPHADSGERTYASFNHYIGLLSLLDATFIGLIGAIVMWQVKRKESPFLDDHGRESVNFQLSLLLYMFAGTAIVAILSFGLLVLPWIAALYIVRLVFCIKGGLAAGRGEHYRYPVTIRFLG